MHKVLIQLAAENKINPNSIEGPKEPKWLVRRINTIKPNLQQELDIEIKIERNSKNTSIIKIEKNNSDNSGEHKMSPDNESLSSYFDSLSPVSNSLSPEANPDFSTNSDDSGNTGHTGDKLDIMIEEEAEEDKTNDYTMENSGSKTDSLIGYRKPFYFCKEHPGVENIYRETIEQHILYSTVHKSI